MLILEWVGGVWGWRVVCDHGWLLIHLWITSVWQYGSKMIQVGPADLLWVQCSGPKSMWLDLKTWRNTYPNCTLQTLHNKKISSVLVFRSVAMIHLKNTGWHRDNQNWPSPWQHAYISKWQYSTTPHNTTTARNHPWINHQQSTKYNKHQATKKISSTKKCQRSFPTNQKIQEHYPPGN